MTERSKRESLFISIILALIAIVILIDVVEDLAAGASVLHVALEISVLGLSLTALTWIWSRIFQDMRGRMEVSQQRLQELESEAARWKEGVAKLRPNLQEALDQQFAAWKLTQAEQDIARLMLKGLSNKEIAEIRSSSDSTIKQQTNAIYRKSGLGSRSQLAAFFLEDLF